MTEDERKRRYLAVTGELFTLLLGSLPAYDPGTGAPTVAYQGWVVDSRTGKRYFISSALTEAVDGEHDICEEGLYVPMPEIQVGVLQSTVAPGVPGAAREVSAEEAEQILQEREGKFIQ